MKVIWQVDDGYVGGRPKTTDVPDEDIFEADSVDEAFEVIHEAIQEDYEQRISWFICNLENLRDKVEETFLQKSGK